jgi:hypothetical protein
VVSRLIVAAAALVAITLAVFLGRSILQDPIPSGMRMILRGVTVRGDVLSYGLHDDFLPHQEDPALSCRNIATTLIDLLPGFGLNERNRL